MAVVISRFEVYLVSLDPASGHEMRKTRPCLVVSPDEMNHHIGAVIVAPMTTGGGMYPTRIPVTFKKKRGRIALDQIRTVDKTRLVKRLGKIGGETARRVSLTLQEMFTL